MEFAAEVRDAIDALWVHEPALDRDRVNVTVIEGADRLLSANPEEVSAYAASQLARRGVALMLGEHVASVDSSGEHLASGGHVEAELRVWTAGIRGPRLLERVPGLPLGRGGRLRVDRFLRCEGSLHLYALGDCGEWIDPATSRPAPYTAQVASAQARYLARQIGRIAQDDPAPDATGDALPFTFNSAGSIVPLGDSGAAGNLTTRFGRRSREHYIQGLSARMLYTTLYRRHEYTIHGWRTASARWLAERLANSYEPALKLH